MSLLFRRPLRLFCVFAALAVVLGFATPGFAASEEKLIEHPDSPEHAELCKAVTKRLRSVPDFRAMLANLEFPDGQIFTRPDWHAVDAMDHLDVMRSLYVYNDVIPRTSDAKREEIWQQYKAKAINDIKTGYAKMEVADVKIEVTLGWPFLPHTPTLTIYRISTPGVSSLIDFYYVIQDVEFNDQYGLNKFHNIPIRSGLSNDLFLFKGVGYLIPVLDKNSPAYVFDADVASPAISVENYNFGLPLDCSMNPASYEAWPPLKGQ